MSIDAWLPPIDHNGPWVGPLAGEDIVAVVRRAAGPAMDASDLIGAAVRVGQIRVAWPWDNSFRNL